MGFQIFLCLDSQERQVVFSEGSTIYGLGVDTQTKRQIISTSQLITGTITCFQTVPRILFFSVLQNAFKYLFNIP